MSLLHDAILAQRASPIRATTTLASAERLLHSSGWPFATQRRALHVPGQLIAAEVDVSDRLGEEIVGLHSTDAINGMTSSQR